jgi:Family of unknown function (DUF5309)
MSVAVMSSYDQVGVKEDISDIITNISPTKTPFQAMIGSEGIHQRTHQWQEDSLIAANAANAAVEGADASAAVQNPTVMRSNTTQILTKTAKVTGTADVTKTYGRDKELAYQLSLRAAELKRDFEASLVGVNQAAVTGSDGVARSLGSYGSMIDTTVNFAISGTNAGALGGTAGTASPLYEQAVLTTAQQLYIDGAEPNTLMVKPGDKVVVSSWKSGGSVARTQFIDNGDKKITNVVDVYESPFGDLKVVMNRFQLTSTALIFEPSMWKKLVLRNWFRMTLAKTGDSTNVEIVGEFSLKHRNFKASGIITNLA